MKSIIQKYNQVSLILRIIIGMVIGAVLALIVPQASAIGILGSLFVGALKAIAPILVFFIVMSSLASASAGIGKQFRTVILLYIVNTFLGAALAVVFAFVFPTTLTLAAGQEAVSAPSGIGEVLSCGILGMILYISLKPLQKFLFSL